LAAGAPSNVEAQRLYAAGLSQLRVLDALAARNLLQQAVVADPESPMVRVALADAWGDAGLRRQSQTGDASGRSISRPASPVRNASRWKAATRNVR